MQNKEQNLPSICASASGTRQGQGHRFPPGDLSVAGRLVLICYEILSARVHTRRKAAREILWAHTHLPC